MHRSVLGCLLAVGLTVGIIPYSQNVSGYIEQDTPFRVVCILNSAKDPIFNIKINGFAANGTVLFRVIFGGYPNYMMSLVVGSLQGSQPNTDYNVLVSEYGVPKVPVLLAYFQGLFTIHSSGKGYYLAANSHAAELETVAVSANGANLVDCMGIECFIDGNFARFIQ